MKSNKNAESLIGIVVAIFILSFTLLGIVNILNFNNKVSFDYSKQVDKNILSNNSNEILDKLDLSKINDDENFYIYKDNINKKYEIYTGSLNQEYKYINNLGEKIDENELINKKYIREFVKKNETIGNFIQNSESNKNYSIEKNIEIYNY